MQKLKSKDVYIGRGGVVRKHSSKRCGKPQARAFQLLAHCIVLTLWLATLPLQTAFASPPAGRLQADTWKITAYCACSKCCGKSDGITASGRRAVYGMVACNWLPFGTVLHIKGIGRFVVQDRGARSLFGSKQNHIKHLDVYMPTHKQALQFGVKYLIVEVAK